ncbi:methyltransferase domain-containing protein [Mycena amicta]|nr:methyltransferase domain-containing protein [Mycena amicta]
MPRTNWKLKLDAPYHKFSVAFLIFFTLYLLARPQDNNGKYYDLLSTDRTALINHPSTSRLVRVLEGNERRYQYTIAEREKLITKEGGRHIPVFPPAHSRFYVLFDFFTPAFSCPFSMYRVGTLVEGGKWLCGLERVLNSRRKPIVYSLNHQVPAYSSFEQHMLQRSSGCQVYGFDANASTIAATHWPWGQDQDQDSSSDHLQPQTNPHLASLQSRVHLHHYAIADRTKSKSSKYRSLQGVMKELGHDFVDILKIDLEGGEFETLSSIIADNGDAGKPLPFGQLLVEMHVGWSEDVTTVDHFSKWWERLEAAGLRPFYFEVSMMDVNNMRAEPSVVYWSFMNIRGRHALVDDSLPAYP